MSSSLRRRRSNSEGDNPRGSSADAAAGGGAPSTPTTRGRRTSGGRPSISPRSASDASDDDGVRSSSGGNRGRAATPPRRPSPSAQQGGRGGRRSASQAARSQSDSPNPPARRRGSSGRATPEPLPEEDGTDNDEVADEEDADAIDEEGEEDEEEEEEDTHGNAQQMPPLPTTQIDKLLVNFGKWRASSVEPFAEAMAAKIQSEGSASTLTRDGEEVDWGVDGLGIPESPQDLMVRNPRYRWRNILGMNYADRPDLMPQPRGLRDPTRRFPWEMAELDCVLLLPMGDYDVEYLLWRFGAVLSSEASIDPSTLTLHQIRPVLTGDFHFALLLACAICRRWMSEFAPKHPDCGVETITQRFAELLRAASSLPILSDPDPPRNPAHSDEEAAAARYAREHAPITDPMARYLLKYFLEMQQLAARHFTRVLCDMTKAPTRPVDLMGEALRVGMVQHTASAPDEVCGEEGDGKCEEGATNNSDGSPSESDAIATAPTQQEHHTKNNKRQRGDEPRLDLDERTSCEAQKYVRRCAPMHCATDQMAMQRETVLSFGADADGRGGIPLLRSFKMDDDEAAYLRHITTHLPTVMSVPHPLSSFAVRPLNPIVALGNHFTCDLCYVPYIRASYQAVQDDEEALETEGEEEDDADTEMIAGSQSRGGDDDAPSPSPSSTAAEKKKLAAAAKALANRNVTELIKNCYGFDLCLRCTAQYYNESLRCVTDAVGWSRRPHGGGKSAAGVGAVTTGAPPASFPQSPASKQVTLCEFVGGASRVASPVMQTPFSSPTTAVASGGGGSATSVLHAQIRMATVGERPIIGINNQLQILDHAVVKLRGGAPHMQSCSSITDSINIAESPATHSAATPPADSVIIGTLILKCAVAPMGARPIARKWRPQYVDAIQQKVERDVRRLVSSSAPPPPSPPAAAAVAAGAIAAAQLMSACDAMEGYFSNAAACYAKRCLSAEERALLVVDSAASPDGGAFDVNNDDDDNGDENNCPICMESLAPRSVANRDALHNADINNPDADFAGLIELNEEDAAVGGGAAMECCGSSSLMTAASSSTLTSPQSKRNTATAAKGPTGNGSSSALRRAVIQTTCRHWFHAHCIDRYFAESKNTNCPLCRTSDALDTLTAKRFTRRRASQDSPNSNADGEGEPAVVSRGPTEENEVTPAMIAAEAVRNLQQNIYELRIPLTAADLAGMKGGGSSSADTGSAAPATQQAPLRVLVGTLVSLDCQYHNPTDIGCLAQLEVHLVNM